MHATRTTTRGLALRGLLFLIVAAAIVLALVLFGIPLARTYLWFGSPPAAVDFASRFDELARRATGVKSSASDAWPLYQQITNVVIDAEATVTGGSVRMSDGTLRFTIDYTSPAQPPVDGSDAAELALRAMQEQERRGVEALLDRLAEQPGAVRPPGSTGKLLARPTDDLTAARQLLRAQAVRFALAYRAGNDELAIAQLRRGLGLAWVLGHQPTLIEHLTASAAAVLLHQAVREEFVARHPSEQTARSVLPLVSQSTVASIDLALEGERIVGLDALSATLPDSLFRPMSRGAQMEALGQFYDLAIPDARLPRAERDTRTRSAMDAFIQELEASHSGAQIMIPALGKAILSDDTAKTWHAGTILMVAVELYATAHGAPPSSLAQLVPEILPALPQDPFSTTGFVYRLIPRGEDPHGRLYLLYSVALDGQDNAGKVSPDGAFAAGTPKGAGFDLVLNAPR